jgi:hypothetical protein
MKRERKPMSLSVGGETDQAQVAHPAEARARAEAVAALEALFAPKDTLLASRETSRDGAATARATPRIVSLPSKDAAHERREKLLGRLLAAEGPRAIARATEDYVGPFGFPRAEEEACVKLLDHPDEALVREAIESLRARIESAPPRRRALVEARHRRLEDGAEEPETRALATQLRGEIKRRFS